MDIKTIDEKYKKNIAEFCDNILQTNPDKISSICLYGENNHILFVLNNEETADFFYTNSRIIQKFNKKNIISLFMTKKHIQTSQDVFPLEFLDIKNSSKIIFGEDIFSGININMENLRLQAEQQTKGLLIRFYQILLEIGDDKKKIRSMINNSLDIIFVVFRGAVFLKQNEYFIDKNEVVDTIEKSFEIDLKTIKQILIKSQKNEYYDKQILNSFITEIQKFAYLLDGVKAC
jgi:hypothetical protein